jgi:hypothetical protein
MLHELKTWPWPFQAMKRGEKTFEIRKDDRGYAVGDTLHLREWDPDTKEYSGDTLDRVVTYLVHGPAWKLPRDMVVMSVAPTPPAAEGGER